MTAASGTTQREGDGVHHRPHRIHAIVLAGFLLGSLALFAPADLHAADTVVSATTGDSLQHTWYLAWLPHALALHINPLFSTSVISPTGVNMMWNTWIPLPALVLAPVTLLAGPVVAFDVAVTVGVALSGWCMYLAAARFVRRVRAAVLAGAAYGFSPFVLDQAYTGHSNLVMVMVPPLLVLAFDTIAVRQDVTARRAGLLLGVLLTVQFFTTEELLASEAMVMAVATAWLAVIGHHRIAEHWRFAVRALAWTMLLFVPLVAYPLWFQFFGPAVPRHVVSDTNFFVTDLLNIVLPSTAQGVDPGFAKQIALHYSGNAGEWGGYIGLPMLAAVSYTAWREWHRPLVRLSCAIAGTMLVLSLGSTLHVGGTDTGVRLPAALLTHVPVFENLLPARLALYVALFTALLFGILVDSLPSTRRSTLVVALVSALIAGAFVPPLPFPARTAVTPPYFTDPSSFTPGSTVLIVPFSHDFYTTQAMLWQAQAGMVFTMPEGYINNRHPGGSTGQGPPDSVTSRVLEGIAAGSITASDVPAADRARMLVELHRWQVTSVVVGPMDHRAAAIQFLTELLGPNSVERSGVRVWHSGLATTAQAVRDRSSAASTREP